MSGLRSLDLLKKYQIPVPNSFTVNDFDEARVLFNEQKIKFPVVLKGDSDNILHKTDLGLVFPNIHSYDQLLEAFNCLNSNITKNKVSLEQIRIEEMVVGGVEIFIGGKKDTSLGNILTIGSGGIFTEIYQDSYSNLMSDDHEVILGYLKKTKVFQILNGFRNLPKKDVNFVIKVIIALKKIMDENKQITEFDLNPLIVLEKGGFAVDFNLIENNNTISAPLKKIKKIHKDIFECDIIAVVGASDNEQKIGNILFKNAIGDKKKHKVFPINNRREYVFGEKTYPSITAIPAKFNIGICVVCVPAEEVINVIKDCCEKKVKLVVIISTGFKEFDTKGERLEKELLHIIQNSTTKVLGPNCMGMISPIHDLNLAFASEKNIKGNIGLILQSGGIFSFIINNIYEKFQRQNIGFSYAFSVGNQSDLNLLDIFAFLVDDENTKVILLYLEGIDNGQEFINFCKNKEIGKPIIVIKSGASEKSRCMALTHTGAMISHHEVLYNIFDTLGFITTSSVFNAISIASFLSKQESLCFEKPIIFSNSGGLNMLINEYLDKHQCELHILSGNLKKKLKNIYPKINCNNNPIDILGELNIDRIKAFLEVFNADESSDSIIFIGLLYTLYKITAEDIIALKNSCSKNILFCILNLNADKDFFDKLAKENIFIFTSLESFLPVLSVLLKMKNGKFKKE